MHELSGVLCTVVVWLVALQVRVRAAGASSAVVQLVYRVDEDCRLGTPLADLKTDSRLSEQYSSAVVDQLRIVMLSTQSQLDSRRHFNVNQSTGLVRAASSLDRDDICPAALSCLLNIDFAVQPAAYFRLIKVWTRLPSFRCYVLIYLI